MNAEQIARNQHFLTAFRANPRKAKQTMRDAEGGRCCLCVAFDTAIQDGFVCSDTKIYLTLPPETLADWYGWPWRNPNLAGCRASDHNDGSGTSEKTHAEIANLFQKEFNIPEP